MGEHVVGVDLMNSSVTSVNTPALESLDGLGAGDHDVLYVFGRLPRATAPFPFSTREFARLLILRGRLRTHPVDRLDAPPACAKSTCKSTNGACATNQLRRTMK